MRDAMVVAVRWLSLGWFWCLGLVSQVWQAFDIIVEPEDLPCIEAHATACKDTR